MTLNTKIGGFVDFLISGCDTNLYHSQGGATVLSLCDPDREFSICILTSHEHPSFQLNYWTGTAIGFLVVFYQDMAMRCFSNEDRCSPPVDKVWEKVSHNHVPGLSPTHYYLQHTYVTGIFLLMFLCLLLFHVLSMKLDTTS